MQRTQTVPSQLDVTQHLPESHVQSLAHIEAGYWWYLARVAWAKKMIREWWLDMPDEATTYADLGCGTGGFAREIARAFEMSRIALVDGDVNALKALRPFRNSQVVPMDFAGDWELPFRPHLITCMDVLEHLPDDAAFLKRAAGQLQRGGCMLVSVPAHQSFFSDWDRRLGHYRRYNRRQLERVVKGAGLEIQKVKYMWSFLTPAAPIRKLTKLPEGAPVEFQPVPKWVNQTLLTLSKIEWRLSEKIPFPFGTSVMLSAIKP